MPTPDLPSSIDTEYSEVASLLATEQAAEELLIHPNGLQDHTALFERYKNEIMQEFATYKQRQKNGAAKLAVSLQELIDTQPELFTDEILEEIAKLTTLEERIAKDEAAFKAHIAEAGNLQELAGISDSGINMLYMAAKRLYDKQAFDDAADAFFFLTAINPLFIIFWLGLANSEFHRKSYKEAITAYEKVVEATPEDPTVYLALCHAYEALGDRANALQIVDTALQTCVDKDELEEEKLRLER